METEPVESVLQAHLERGEVAGLTWLVADGDDVAYGALGTFEYGGKWPVRPDTIFRISSLTKPISAALALMLVTDGQLALDEPVDAHLPELADRRVLVDPGGPLDDTVPANRAITLRDLLTFRCGIGHDFISLGQQPVMSAIGELALGAGPPAPQELPPRDEWLRRLGTLPLERQPGERWLYDTPSNVLGALIERATGQALGEALAERILAPLGMVDTGFFVPPDEHDRFGSCFGAERAVYDPPDGQWAREPAFASASGGLVSTIADYFAFADALRRGRLLAPEVLAEMTANVLTPEQLAESGPSFEADIGWGLGLGVRVREHAGQSIGTYGWDGGLGATWRTDPHRDRVAILLTNQSWDSPAGPEIAHRFTHAVFTSA